jgi:hypothetical protein
MANNPHIAFAFGRLNPPHYGHEGLINTIASVAKQGAWALFLSKSHDAKKNPLTYVEKIAWVKLLYPQVQGHLVEDPNIKTFLQAAAYLYDKGFRSATFVAGEDDMASMRPVLEQYNGKEVAHGYYKFEPLSFMESPRLTSATNARKAAEDGDPDAFERATRVPQNMTVDDKTLFQAVRRGMGLGESMEETFDKPYRGKWEKSEFGSYDMLVPLPDGTNLSVMFNNEGDAKWQVEFWRNNSQDVTGEGDAQRIFATVLNAIQKFIKKHKPLQITFSVDKEVESGSNKQSRAKLYNRLVDRYATSLGYDARTIDDGYAVRYNLTRNSNESKFIESIIPESLSVEQLAHISDKALDDAYHYGLSTPGANFGWLANIESATAAKRMIDSGITDVDAIASAIHDGWNKTAVADYMGKLQLDAPTIPDKKKKRYALAQQTYGQLPEVEKEKDRVVARAMLQALGVQINEDLTPDQWNELRITDPKAYMGNKDYTNRRWWTLEFKKARAAAREKGAQRFEFPPGSKNSYMVAPDLANEGKVKLYTDPDYFGAEVDDSGFDSLPIINIPTKELVGFEPDEKMKLPKAQANVAKIIDGLEKNENIPPILVRKYKGGYQVLDGHHRFWAYKTLKKDSIPARLVPDSDIEEISKNKVNEELEEGEGFEQEAGIGIDGKSFKFKIRDLVALADKYPVVKVDPKQFADQIAGREEDETQSMARMQKADLQYPIIVVKRQNGQFWIADGTHRAHKAILNKLPSINAKVIPIADMAQFAVKESVAEGLNEVAEKSTKAEAKYQAMPRNGQRCDHCTMWRPPHGCSAVSGKIAANGWCSYYKRSHRKDLEETESLDEAASPVLFHYTGSVGAALNILKNNEFMLSISTGTVEAPYAPKGYNYFLSTTRSKVGGYHELTGGTAVMFNLDGNWFNRRYPVKAIDYWAGFDKQKHSESEDRIFAREPTIPADAITAVHILLKEAGEFASPTTRQLMIVAKKRGLPTYLYSNENAWKLQDTKRAIPVSKAQDLIRGQKKTGYVSTSNYGKRMLGPWLELIFKKSRSELSKRANELRYSLTYWNGGQFADDLGLRNEISNARKPGNSGYDQANKIIAAMRKIGVADLKGLLTFLHKKWDAEAQQPAKSDNAAQSAIAKIRAATAKKESVEEALDTNETHGWILPNRRVEYVGSEEHLSWLYDNDIDGYEEAFTQGYVRFVNLPNTFFLEGTLGSLKKLYRVYAASALSRPNIAVDVYYGNRGNATSSHDFRIPQEKAKFMQLLGPSSVGEHAGSIIGTVGGGNDYPDRQVAVFPWDRWVQPDTGGSEVDYVGELDEVNMSPGSLAKFAATPQAQAMTIGFEAEMLVPGLEDEDDDESDPRQDARNWDMTKDIKFPITRTWQDEVLNWYKDAGTGESDLSAINDDLLTLKHSFIDYIVEKNPSMIDEMLKPENLKVIAKKIYDDLGGRRSGWSGQREIRDRIADEPNNPYGLGARARAIFFTKTINELSTEDYEKQWKKFLKSENVKHISDWVLKYAEYGGGGAWFPYLKPNMQPSGVITIAQLAKNWNEYSGFKTKVSSGYHGAKRDATSWILEPDGSISGDDSGIELVSPPMPLQQGIAALDKFFQWAGQNGYYGNTSTGFHVGVSLPEELQAKVDPLKVVMLLGDQYVLDLFDRGSNAYTKSMFTQIQKMLKRRGSATTPQEYAKKLRTNLAKVAKEIINRSISTDRYVSVNIKTNYIEFRSAGGNFMEHIDDIKNTVLRYVQVMAIAADPQAYREEYAKKLYAMIAKHIPQDDDQLSNFTMYASGLIDQNVLKMRLQKRQTDKADAAARSAFVASTKIYRVWIGEPPYGSNLSDPKRFATPSEAYAWAKSYADRLSSTFDAKSLYLEPDDHSIPPIVLDQPASGAWLQ